MDEKIKEIKANIETFFEHQDKHIDEFYRNKKELESEKAYFTFVLGYDLLNDMLSKSSTPENDISFDFCNMLAHEYLQSEEYRNEKYSAYEMLEQWVNKNKDYIKTEYAKFTGTEIQSNKIRQLDNALVLDVGYRNNQPIALVERNLGDSKEYVIGFMYRIENNKIDWGYGYYYGTDLNKAKQDFKKVLAGGNLADTFNKNKKDRER